MKLTARELKLVERLRKHERQWRRTRWLLIVGGAGFIAMWAWLLWRLCQATETPTDAQAAVLLRVFAFPKVLFGLSIGAAMIGIALRDWVGSPSRALLLRLIEEHQIPGQGSEEAPEADASAGGRAVTSKNHPEAPPNPHPAS